MISFSDVPRTYVFAFVIIIWPFLFIWQGLDLTDMGYWLTGYQQFYMAPQGINEGLVNWLSYFIGHWSGKFFGETILSYKLAYVAVVSLSGLLTYHYLSTLFEKSYHLAAVVLLTVMFTGKSVENWIDYNNLTALFYLVGAVLLYFGLVRERSGILFLAGGVLGANLFVRFPNILGLGLIMAVWFYGWAKFRTVRRTSVWSMIFIVGFAVGIGLVWTLINIHDHEIFYIQGLLSIFNMASDVSSHHSGGLLLKMFFRDHMLAFGLALPFLVIGWLFFCWASGLENKLKIVIYPILVVITTMTLLYREIWIWLVPGLCYLTLIVTAVRDYRKNIPLALAAVIAGIVLFLAPLGSGNGIQNAVYGMWLALPLTIMIFFQEKSLLADRFLRGRKGQNTFGFLLAMALFGGSQVTQWFYTYRDSRDRFEMLYAIPNPALVGTFTTESRAKTVHELIDALQSFVKPGDLLFAYNEIPLVHFLSQTVPWLGNPWPMLYGPEKLQRLLNKKENSMNSLPIIVRATGNTSTRNWPMYSSVLDTSDRENESRIVLADFEARHGYRVAWRNDFFEILTVLSPR